MRVISTNDFRNNLAEYLTEVDKNNTPLAISRFGRPVVVVSPYKETAEDVDKYFGFMPGAESGADFVNRVRRSKAEKKYVERLRKGRG